jgi:hypothetical protein
MKPTSEEYDLLKVISFLMVADSEIDFSKSFWTVLGDITMQLATSLLLATIFYFVIVKPVYTWMRKND